MFKRKNQNISTSAFTLIEMLIVLIIMGILLLMTVWLSWQQIQKIQNKAVKESILSEWQTRYSRNLWSSSFAWLLYDYMEANLELWDNQFKFIYVAKGKNEENKEIIFTDKFEIKYIIMNYNPNHPNEIKSLENVELKYYPYKMSCTIWWEEDGINDLSLITKINDSQYYCFVIQEKNCRLVEMSELNCNNIKSDLKLDIEN